MNGANARIDQHSHVRPQMVRVTLLRPDMIDHGPIGVGVARGHACNAFPRQVGDDRQDRTFGPLPTFPRRGWPAHNRRNDTRGHTVRVHRAGDLPGASGRSKSA